MATEDGAGTAGSTWGELGGGFPPGYIVGVVEGLGTGVTTATELEFTSAESAA